MIEGNSFTILIYIASVRLMVLWQPDLTNIFMRPIAGLLFEWPAVIMPLLKEKVCLCEIDYYDNQRIITLEAS